MSNKKTLIGAILLLALIGGATWHLYVKHIRPKPFKSVVWVEEVVVPTPPAEKKSKRPPTWLNIDGELPTADTPRPFKHLTDRELHTYDTDALSDEDWLLLQNEVFFRMPKDWRDKQRKAIAEAREWRKIKQEIDALRQTEKGIQ